MTNRSDIKFSLNTTDYKWLIQNINSPPFNFSFSLVSFDEQSNSQLLKTVQTVIKHLDPWSDLILDKKNEEEIAKLSDLLEIIQYPE